MHSRNTPNGNCPVHGLVDKKASLGTRLSEHMELHSIDGEEADSITHNHLLLISPTPSPGADSANHNNVCNFSPAENRRNIVVPEIQPWPPSPYEKVNFKAIWFKSEFLFFSGPSATTSASESAQNQREHGTARTESNGHQPLPEGRLPLLTQGTQH